MPAPLSVIIPTLNAASALGPTAESLLSGATEGLIRELVISDGGSSDDTARVARELGALWVTGEKGRGGQIARGINTSSAPWLLILHADTCLSENWTEAARVHMNAYQSEAGYFRLRFRTKGAAARIVETGANLRARLVGLPYGDQGLLIARETLNAIGGYPELPLMEDVALAGALGGRLRKLNAIAHTSAERYLTEGWVRRVTRNLGTLMRYQLGATPESLQDRYNKP